MRSESTLQALAEAPVGVLGFTARDLTPRAVAVTPYVIAGEPTPLPSGLVTDGDEISISVDVPDRPGCLLVHHETVAMAELLSLTLRGNVTNRVLTVEVRRGGLEPQEPAAIAQLNSLRALGRAAKVNRPTIQSWIQPREEETTS